MSAKRKRSPEPSQDASGNSVTIFRSSPIEDRSSTFIAYYSPSVKPKDLQNLEEISSASHKILAWRKASNQQSISGGTKYVTDSDDDGEKYAGKKIEKVLESMNVTGSCVVARWYGGVLLGPVRFTHVETCAAEAVRKWRDAVSEQQLKKRKAEQDAHDQARLTKVLTDRDQSIKVLRTLAVEKENELKSAAQQDGIESQAAELPTIEQKNSSTPAKTSDEYAGMSVERLRGLEKSRDATLSFLLKRIDRAEAKLQRLRVPESTD